LSKQVREGKQAGSLLGFGFSVGFKRPDNVPAYFLLCNYFF